MTTIATDGKTMAGDSLTSAKTERLAYGPKIHRAADGSVFGCSGITTKGVKFRRWMTEGGDKPELGEDFCALSLSPDGKVFYWNDDLEPIEYLAPMAIGSGADYAIGAMLAGKTPAEAVAIAAMRDSATDGQITVLEPHHKPKLEAA